MRVTSRLFRKSLGSALASGLVIGALLVPAAALADDGSSEPGPFENQPGNDRADAHGIDGPNDGLEDSPDDGALRVGAPDDAIDEVDDETLRAVPDDAPDRPTAAPPCDDLLSVITWDGSGDLGDERAVAVTAQVLEAGTPGWASASWAAQAGTTLRAVFAVRVDGTVTELAPRPTKTVTNVVAFTFCGTTTPQAAPVAAVAECDDLLSVITPTRTQGDALAVAITAQALDADVPGWSNVGWEAAEGTRLRAVLVTGRDGTVTQVRDTTSATDVASLSFCGTADRAGAGSTAPGSTAPAVTAPAVAAPREVPRPAPSAPTSTSTTSTSPRTAPAPPAPATVGATDEDATNDLPRVVAVETPEAPEAPPEPDVQSDQPEEAEVMGIQLTRDDEVGGNGPISTGMAALAAFALLATAGGVLWSRRS
jgi:hypothetical protein